MMAKKSRIDPTAITSYDYHHQMSMDDGGGPLHLYPDLEATKNWSIIDPPWILS